MVARELAAEGADLALLARSEPALVELAGELEGRHQVRTRPVPVDLSTAEGAASGMDQAIEVLGGIDVLINSAGSSPFGSFDRVGDQDWYQSFDLKVMGYVRCTRAALPTMRAQRSGRIVNVVGMAGRYATPGYVLGALNAALLHLTKTLAELLASDGITVVAVNPGLTETDRVRDAMRTWADDEGVEPDTYARDYASRLPLRRLAAPEEVARMVVVMASDLSEYVTGSAVQVDGASSRGAF
jgi:NAD(P)-dependent dehydrogenase (short-subunit alcohol dehydrogenase family)